MPRGHHEALSDAWANLYLEFAIAIDERRRGVTLPENLIAPPSLLDGKRGMEFVEAAVHSAQTGAWVSF